MKSNLSTNSKPSPQIIITAIPTLIAALIILILNILPQNEVVEISFVADNVSFIADLPKNQKYVFIKAIPISKIGFIHFNSVQINFQKLLCQSVSGSLQLIAKNGFAFFKPQYTEFSEFRINCKNMKLGSLEIGANAKVHLTLRDKVYANKLQIEISNYNSHAQVQLFQDSIKIMAERCEIFVKNRLLSKNSTYQNHFIAILSPVYGLSEISGIDSDLILNVDFIDSLYQKTTIFETGNHNIPIQAIGFFRSDEKKIFSTDTIYAYCKELKITGKPRIEMMNKKVFFLVKDLTSFSINKIDLNSDVNSNICISLVGYPKKFRAGATKEEIHNLLPSVFESIIGSSWVKVISILIWLLTTSYSFYKYLKNRGKK